MDATRFDGQTALVTGAARGLGLAIAEALAWQGAYVFLGDVDVAVAETAAQALREGGFKARAIALDVTDEAAWQQVIDTIEAETGGLHVLVNNAGIISRHSIASMPTEIWQRVLDINLTGPFFGMRLTAPLIARSGGGAIVNISSIAGMAAHPDPIYAASKWGLRGLTKTAAVEFAASGIRVNSVHPAMIMTELQNSAPPGYAEASTSAIVLGRPAEASEVAAAVAFLACAESSFITGTELLVDGGLIAGGVVRMRRMLQQQFAAKQNP
jgi:3alpha(or 20beta)-hydroxysteroid dehydrogenase